MGDSKVTYISSRQVALLVLVFISLASSAVAIEDLQYGSKVKHGDPDEGKALSPFYFAPQFAFLNLNYPGGIPDQNEPVYLHTNPTVPRVSKDDIRITAFGDNSSPSYPAGSKVKVNDTDCDRALTIFGTGRIPTAELRYLDLNGTRTYSIDDPVYLEFNHDRSVTPGDVRITSYGNYSAGSRVTVRDEDPYINMQTSTLPGMLCFYNFDGDIDNNGLAHYGTEDSIYIDTQYPFYTVTMNDIRMTPLT